MVTRSQVGIVKRNPRYNFHTSHISPLPKSPSTALSDSNWRDAMYDEYNALVKNGTWVLVLKPPNVNVVRSMWLFRHKYHADGSLSRYKARLVANGRSQQIGFDCGDTFSPVVKPATIRTVLSLALSRSWPVHQLDVKNAFLNGDLSETVYMYQPSGFVDHQFPQHHGTVVAYLLIYVDDIVLTASSTALLHRIIASLHREKYAMKLLEQAHMVNCNPTRTPVDIESKLGPDGDPVSDPTLYLSLAALKRVLCYVRGTLNFGLQLYASPTGSLVAYFDADWAGCSSTRRSTFGYCVFLGDNLLLWSSKRQHTISRSSAEAEYRGVANAVAETAWIRNLLRELHSPLFSSTLVYCDNVSTIYLTANPVQHQRTKHIEIDIHFVCDMVARGQVRVLHVPSRYQYADIFTKGLPSTLFEKFRTSLSVRSPPALTAKEFAFHAINARRLPLAPLVYTLVRPPPLPPAPVAQKGQLVAPEITIAYTALIKGSKEIAGLMLMTMEPEIQ
ncbi:ribonuclease H-like domain-containing protein [Tanacetum coccineum]